MPSFDYKRALAGYAEALRARAANEAERRTIERLRTARLAKQLRLRTERAAHGDDASIAWLERRRAGELLLRAYTAGMGRRRGDAPDGWSYSLGMYV